jgi:putative nucleotidyltransferase with HDIG domain
MTTIAPGASTPRASLVGQVIANHRLITELGSGGMGTVYYAEHVVIGRRAAIKILHPEIAHDEQVVTRFLNEARAVNEIRHPNVVEITDMGRHGDLHYIVMSFLEGETLAERLDRLHVLDEPTALRIVRQVASALGAAHERGIVHRDLKPENIFITNHPDFPDHVKVLDFGIAKLTARDGSVKPLTSEGTIMGTPTYMSPEQCRGMSDLDLRSDIYSLGVVLYQMVTGLVPFSGQSTMDVLVAQIATPPIPPIDHQRKLPPTINQVILTALEKEPRDRFASMRDLLQALDPTSAPELVVETAAPAAGGSDSPETRAAKPVANKLSEIIQSRIANDRLVLPAMPVIALECMRVLKDARQSFRSIGDVIAKDPLLASRILKLANSAAFPGVVPAATLEAAIGRMGLEGLGVALVQFSLNQAFTSRDDRIRSSFHGIWQHSLAVALIAKDLAQAVAQPGTDPSAVYLGGLLHDVGKPVVASMLVEAEKQLAGSGKTVWMGESVWRQIVSDSHRAVGVLLGRKWKLPADVCKVIEDCRSYDRTAPRSSANLVGLANALAKRAGVYVGTVDHEAVEKTVESGARLLGLSDAAVLQSCAEIYKRVDTMVDGASTGGRR